MTPGKAPPTSTVEVPGGELLISSTSRPEMMKDLDIVGLARLTSVSHGRLIPCLKEGNSVCSHTAQPPGESLCQGAGQEAPTNSRTSGSGKQSLYPGCRIVD